MAFTPEEIKTSHAEDIGREDLHSPYARAGLDGYIDNPGRRTFKPISLRYIPDFTANDFELRLVVAQTAYSHFRRSLPWKRVPEELTIDPPALTSLIAERLEKQSRSRPDFLNRFNTTKDYVACLSAVAYFKWRVGLHHDEIAESLRIPVDMVTALAWRLRCSAHRLGMPVKCWVPPKGRSRSEVTKAQWANPESRAKLIAARIEGTKRRWERPGAREEQRRKQQRAWANDPDRQERLRARTKAMNLERFLRTVAWG